ncbi:MAG: hypothetical protein IPN26_07765 [Bacteroidetes bacterium]|nr:hypothetical protein [Bacteroidota bacterium]
MLNLLNNDLNDEKIRFIFITIFIPAIQAFGCAKNLSLRFDKIMSQTMIWNDLLHGVNETNSNTKSGFDSWIYVVHIYSLDTNVCKLSFICTQNFSVREESIKSIKGFKELKGNLVLFTFDDDKLEELWKRIYTYSPVTDLNYNLYKINVSTISSYIVHYIFVDISSSKVKSERYFDIEDIPRELLYLLPYKKEYMDLLVEKYLHY